MVQTKKNTMATPTKHHYKKKYTICKSYINDLFSGKVHRNSTCTTGGCACDNTTSSNEEKKTVTEFFRRDAVNATNLKWQTLGGLALQDIWKHLPSMKRCTGGTVVGESCHSDADCVGESTCTTEHWNKGYCIPSTDATCQLDTNCDNGLICDHKRCMPPGKTCTPQAGWKKTVQNILGFAACANGGTCHREIDFTEQIGHDFHHQCAAHWGDIMKLQLPEDYMNCLIDPSTCEAGEANRSTRQDMGEEAICKHYDLFNIVPSHGGFVCECGYCHPPTFCQKDGKFPDITTEYDGTKIHVTSHCTAASDCGMGESCNDISAKESLTVEEQRQMDNYCRVKMSCPSRYLNEWVRGDDGDLNSKKDASDHYCLENRLAQENHMRFGPLMPENENRCNTVCGDNTEICEWDGTQCKFTVQNETQIIKAEHLCEEYGGAFEYREEKNWCNPAFFKSVYKMDIQRLTNEIEQNNQSLQQRIAQLRKKQEKLMDDKGAGSAIESEISRQTRETKETNREKQQQIDNMQELPAYCSKPKQISRCNLMDHKTTCCKFGGRFVPHPNKEGGCDTSTVCESANTWKKPAKLARNSCTYTINDNYTFQYAVEDEKSEFVTELQSPPNVSSICRQNGGCSINDYGDILDDIIEMGCVENTKKKEVRSMAPGGSTQECTCIEDETSQSKDNTPTYTCTGFDTNDISKDDIIAFNNKDNTYTVTTRAKDMLSQLGCGGDEEEQPPSNKKTPSKTPSKTTSKTTVNTPSKTAPFCGGWCLPPVNTDEFDECKTGKRIDRKTSRRNIYWNHASKSCETVSDPQNEYPDEAWSHDFYQTGKWGIEDVGYLDPISSPRSVWYNRYKTGNADHVAHVYHPIKQVINGINDDKNDFRKTVFAYKNMKMFEFYREYGFDSRLGDTPETFNWPMTSYKPPPVETKEFVFEDEYAACDNIINDQLMRKVQVDDIRIDSRKRVEVPLDADQYNDGNMKCGTDEEHLGVCDTTVKPCNSDNDCDSRCVTNRYQVKNKKCYRFEYSPTNTDLSYSPVIPNILFRNEDYRNMSTDYLKEHLKAQCRASYVYLNVNK